jgi:probable HAF family extracellular repeat protein
MPRLRGWIGFVGALLALACGGDDAAAPKIGTLEITTVTSGPEPDADGYAVTIDAGAQASIALNGTHRRDDLVPGNHSVQLVGLAANCTVAGDNPRTVSVSAGATATVEFSITCGPTTGAVRVDVSTIGPSPDVDGYTVTLDGAESGSLNPNGGADVQRLVPGDHVLGLSGLAANCQVQGGNPRSVRVVAGSSVSVTFAVTCSTPLPNVGSLRITTSTTGPDPDSDGYELTIDGGASQTIGLNSTATLANVAAGPHSVRLLGIADNCEVNGTNPRSVIGSEGVTTEVSFALTCSPATGTLAVSTTTTGPSVDPDGYTVILDGSESGSIDVSARLTLTGIRHGAHQLGLTELAANCQLEGDNPRGITVTTGSETSVNFRIVCVAPPITAGTVELSTSTTGAQPGGDNYIIAVDDGSSQPIGINSSLTIPNLPPGLHTMTLAGMPANCAVDGDNPRPVVIVAGQTAAVSFAVRCLAIASGYRAIDLGTLGGASSHPSGISPTGQVVGSSQTEEGPYHAFLWENGVMTDLGTPGGGTHSGASSINAKGQIVGSSWTSDGSRGGAFLWEKGVITHLNPFSHAISINDASQVLGTGVSSGGRSHALLWENGVGTDLGTLSGGIHSLPVAINAAGQILALSWSELGYRAFLWDKGVKTALAPLNNATGMNDAGQVIGNPTELPDRVMLWTGGVVTDLGSFGGLVTIAYGINSSGVVVGTSSDRDGGMRAFQWVNGVMTDLGPGFAQAINASGQVVGTTESLQGETHAFVWVNGVMSDLGTLGGPHSSATGINAAGQVIGTSETLAGEEHATLWVPE